MSETRGERMKWCKERALAYLPASPRDAVTSFMSDASKPYGESPNLIDWSKSAMQMLSVLGMRAMVANDPHEARRWIEGFN